MSLFLYAQTYVYFRTESHATELTHELKRGYCRICKGCLSVRIKTLSSRPLNGEIVVIRDGLRNRVRSSLKPFSQVCDHCTVPRTAWLWTRAVRNPGHRCARSDNCSSYPAQSAASRNRASEWLLTALALFWCLEMMGSTVDSKL
jgi:hypothetical protein